MVPSGLVSLQPSRLARQLARVGLPATALLLLLVAATAGSAWPLLGLPMTAAVAVAAREGWDGIRALDLRGPALRVQTLDGSWRTVAVLGGGRLSALAVTFPCRDQDSGRRLRVNVWCDAVDAATFRRLARSVRLGRWQSRVREIPAASPARR